MAFIFVNPRLIYSAAPTYATERSVCKVQSVNVFDEVKAARDGIYEETKSLFIDIQSPLFRGTSPAPQLYYGCAASANVLASRPTPPQMGTDYKVKNRRSWKEFRRLQRLGKIVVSPYSVAKGTTTGYPGINRVFLSGNPTTRVMRRNLLGFWPTTMNNPCNPTDLGPWLLWSDGTQVGVYDKQHAAIKSSQYAGDQYVIPDGNVGSHLWLTPSARDLKEVTSAILALHNGLDFDTGLVTSALAEANSAQWDILTDLAEIKSTISFIVNTLLTILKEARKVRLEIKRLSIQDAAKAADWVAQRWLEYRYAVMPLVYSVNNALLASSYLNVAWKTVRQGLNRSQAVEVNGWVGEVTFRDRCFIKRKLQVTSELSNSQFFQRSATVTAWELVPASFIIDWALNIGDLLMAASSPAGITEQGATYSRSLSKPVVLTHPDYAGGSITVDLTAYRQWPIHPESHIGINLDLNMSWKRWLDALALSWSIGRRLS